MQKCDSRLVNYDYRLVLRLTIDCKCERGDKQTGALKDVSARLW